jgi:phenylalanyl-tRNA synthetase alpha chain
MYTVPQPTDFSKASLDDVTHKVLEYLREEAQRVKKEEDLKLLRDLCLGRKNGVLTQVNNWLRVASPEDKKRVGFHINSEIRPQIDVIVRDATQRVKIAGTVHGILERLDVTLPGIRRPLGAEHPVIRTLNETVAVFRAMGYSVAEGPEVETDYYNFESLNFPPNHPARDTQDTLIIADQEKKPLRERLLLRTHTSPVQIRSMEQMKPPVRIVCPGKVHRRDATDASHSPVFHQVEGLAVDTNITFSDLKGTLDHAMKALFGSSVKTRFFPSFFPFTEPSADVAISCIICGGKGCRTCKQTGWVELMGCGMVDPNVFGFVKDHGYDPAKISGFAFGMGVERLAMMKYGIDDIQMLFQGDVRFLEQFA